jgi:Lrp/AsnC family leucine-responsive transcriptional regulator
MLDKIGIKILQNLQGDGRLTNAELSHRVNLSPAACLERVRRLQEEGYILGYTALLNPVALNAGLLAYIEVEMERYSPAQSEPFRKLMLDIPEVMECHLVTGPFDYLIKARVRDMTAYREFLERVFSTLKGVRRTNSYVVMEELKSSTRIPFSYLLPPPR